MPPYADVLKWEHLPFPRSLPSFQKLFPDDAACASYLERVRWEKGFVCPLCDAKGEPYRFTARPGVLRCKACRQDTALTAGTVMERTRTPLTVWFWGAYLVASMTPGLSAMQFQRQLGLTRYETAFQILHKLRAGMVRPDRDRIGGAIGIKDHVEVDETYIGGSIRGEGKGVHADDKSIVIAAVEVRQSKPKDGDAKLRRREHLQEIGGQRRAGLPVLESDDDAGGWIDLAQAGFDLLGDHGARVISLEAQPGDVGAGVVVAVEGGVGVAHFIQCRATTTSPVLRSLDRSPRPVLTGRDMP